MAQTVIITLTTTGIDTGPFDLYSNVDSFTTPFETGVSKSNLISGYTSIVVPDTAFTIRVQSTGACTNYVDLTVETTTTTTTEYPVSTTTTTTEYTTTTTTIFPYSEGGFGVAESTGAACSALAGSPTQLYWAPATVFGVGVTLYTNSSLTTVFTGGYIAWEGDTTVYIADGTGFVTTNTAIVC